MRDLSSPITAHIEVTEACDSKCRHCYNFQRDGNFKPSTVSWENLENTIAELVKNKVMHIIITGGEPLLALDKSIYLADRCIKNGMSVSFNSNLVSATHDKMRRLREVGVDHCLTTLFSHKPEVHNFMAGAETWDKILRAIQITQDEGIRVSVNTIVSEHNKDDIFETGLLLSKLGVKKFMANRCIPSQSNELSLQKEFLLDVDSMKKLFDDLKRVRALGMAIQTCRTVPECFFDDPDGDDLEFTHRGCHGTRNIMVSPNGDIRTCPHDGTVYGNIHIEGISGAWENTKAWRSGEYIPEYCKDCIRLDTCEAGCRMVAFYCTGAMDGYDNLCTKNPVPPKPDPMIYMREEQDFFIVRELGAKVRFIDK